MEFNLSGMKNIYLESLTRSEPILVFEIIHGCGKFIFLMFFSKEDEESKDRLFIYLRNTQVFLKIKLYGSHRNGDFHAFFTKSDEDSIMQELQLSHEGEMFNFEHFLEKLNQQIPMELPFQTMLERLREVWPLVRNRLDGAIDQADKSTLMGIKRLPVGKYPKDKTLRKLYIYTNGNADVITDLITELKKQRMTLAWTNQDISGKSLAEIMMQLKPD